MMNSSLVPKPEELLLPVEISTVRTENLLPRGLWKLLTEGEDARAAVRIISQNPTLRGECEKFAGLLAERAKPIGDEELLFRLVQLAPVFGIGRRSPEEWRAMFTAYLDALGTVPPEAIEDAILRWNRGELYPKEPGRCAFFPKPAELFALAQPHRCKLGMAAYRAKKALERVEHESHRLTPEERATQRQAAIDAGILTPDGKINLVVKRIDDEAI